MVECHGWKAVLDCLPPEPPRLRVSGTCSCSGQKLQLKRHEPQGINPDELILDLIEVHDDESASREAVDQVVQFREKYQDTEPISKYRTVLIMPGSIRLAVDVVV
jgi:hypothetical protein